MIALSLLIGLVVYIFLAWFSVRVVGWLANVLAVTATTKRISQALTVAIFVLIPTWDIAPGRIHFARLCATEAGQQVFKTLQLGSEFFLAPGEPDTSKNGSPPAKGGELNLSKVRNHFELGKERQSKSFNVTKVNFFIRDRKTGEVLGNATIFEYYGGWLTDYLNEHRFPNVCPEEKRQPYEPPIYVMLSSNVFKPITSPQQKGD
ncbi:MAG TPA: hypothetical protein VNK46_07805 [Nitrospiraceae bacterium]|jgi:hypothetical protein|nr:hypothetical protein [Nitrospiraceae bacterium]